jgi:hypothetical protein
MARIADIPSRYIEGFVVPYNQESDGYREILNSDAHAWVELYFEGVGWVTFDPTPGNSSSAYQFPQNSENSIQTPTENTGINNNPSADEDVRNQNEKNPKEIDGAVGNVKTETSWTDIVSYLFLGILGFGILLFLVSLIAYVLINIFIRKNKRIIDFSKHKMILYGNLTYIPYAGGETLREYLEVLSEKLQMNLDDYILVHEKALYAKHSISLEEQKEIINTMLEARKKVIKYSGRMRFYFSDYINTLQFYIGNSKRSR